MSALLFFRLYVELSFCVSDGPAKTRLKQYFLPSTAFFNREKGDRGALLLVRFLTSTRQSPSLSFDILLDFSKLYEFGYFLFLC